LAATTSVPSASRSFFGNALMSAVKSAGAKRRIMASRRCTSSVAT
jgi:hypothetical protein